MRTIFVVTTKQLPINNDLFVNIVSGDPIIRENWKEFFPAGLDTTWREEDSLSLKYYEDQEQDMIFYVAPCLTKISGIDPINYIKDMLTVVQEDVSARERFGNNEYQIFLIAHDKDLILSNSVKSFVLREHCENDEILRSLDTICGYITFQHSLHDNHEIKINGLVKEINYDIFNDFIRYLNSDIFDDKVCCKLKQQLTQLGLNQE